MGATMKDVSERRFAAAMFGGAAAWVVTLLLGAGGLVLAPAVLAANGQCKWEGGAGAPTYPSCANEDCIGNGGIAQCEDPEVAPPSGKTLAETDGGKFFYTLCDMAMTTATTSRSWCQAGGGTWSNGSCTGGVGASASNEAEANGRAMSFAQYWNGSCSASYQTQVPWGFASSAHCSNGGNQSVNNTIISQGKSREYLLSCPGGSSITKNIMILRTRQVVCKPGSTMRNLPGGGRQCVRPGEGTSTCAAVKVCPDRNNPVSIMTGAKVDQVVDYRSSGAGVPEFVRYYRSSGYFRPFIGATENNGPRAPWRTTYDRDLYPVSGNSTYTGSLHRPGDAPIHFDGAGNGLINIGGGAGAKLETLGGGGWKVTLPNGDFEYYDTFARLSSLVTRGGLTTTLTYATTGELMTVTGPFGHTLTFSYDANNRLSTLTDPAGRVITYMYDPAASDPLSAAVIQVTYPDSTTVGYLYGGSNSGRLGGIIDQNGIQYATYTYDSLGRVISSQNAGGVNQRTYGYSATQTNVLDQLGFTGGYSYTKVAGANRYTMLPQNCKDCDGTIQMFYDANGNVSRRTMRYSASAEYTYDLTRNLETFRKEGLDYSGNPAGSYRTITTQWHPTRRLPTQIDEIGRRTIFTYDASGNLLTRTIRDTATSEQRVWTWTYDTVGRVLTEDGPRTDVSDVTTYAYHTCSTGSQCGQLHTVTNALSQVTTYNSYDQDGRPTQWTDPNGVVTTVTYNFRGQVTGVTSAGETSSYSYYLTGLPKRVTEPDGSWVENDYDNAHRLIRVRDSEGHKIEYTLDGMGNVTAEKASDPGSTLRRNAGRVYDSQGRLWKVVGAAGTAAVTTTIAYNYSGNGWHPATITEPLSRITTLNTDTVGRIFKSTDPRGGVTQPTRNALDQITKIRDPRGLDTNYTINALGDLKQIVSPDTGTTTSTYDAAGNLKTRTDARGRIASYNYDAENRVTSASFLNGGVPDQTLSYTYDVGTNGKGRMTSVSDANHALSWAYDSLGRVTGRGQTVGGVTQSVGYGYSGGQLASMTLPSGQIVTYGYNTHGRVTSVSVGGTTILNGVTYDPFGPVTGWVWGNGSTTTRSFDLDGNVSAISSAGTRTYAYDDAKRITGITDTGNSARSWTLGYDLGDQLNSASSTGTTRGWTYDLNGNRLTETGSAPSTFTVAATSNRVTSITGSLPRTYVYDNAGNVTSRGGATLTYNNAGRLSSVTQGGVTASYVYNALGERVRRTVGAGVTLYVYDEDGMLVGEYDGTGALIQETVWLGDIPVATLRPNGSGGVDVFYIHSDHLNTPRIITRPSDNAERWRWDSDPFGTTAANENPAGIGTFVYNLRFPGQLYDSVAGLTYNYFRDYDAATGSYAQSDPLGLDAGMMSTYSYAAQAPNLYDDPDGRILPAIAYPAAMAYARCFGQCTALDTLAEVVAYGQDCVNGAGILKNCAVECLNPLNYVGVGKILKAARGAPTNIGPYSSKAPTRVPPGVREREGHYVNDRGRVEPWRAHYDQYGRQVGRTDYNAGNRAQGIPDTHYERREYNSRYPQGRRVENHVPGEFPE
jgi:RHS repeat-associated protein